MEAAVRSVQVGPPGQRNDTGPPQQNSTITYQQRVSTGASPIHRSVEQSSRPSPTQSQSRAAASPLSPPRPGPGAAVSFQSFPGQQGREAPIRYVPPNSIYSGVPFRDNLYTRLPTQVTQQPPPPQIEPYHRGGPQPPPTQSIVSSVPNSLSISVSAMESSSNRQRISLLSHADYHSGRPPQAPPDPGGQQSVVTQSGPPAFKKIRLGSENNPNPNINHSQQQIPTAPPPQVVQQQVPAQLQQNLPPNQQQQLTSSHIPPPLLKVDTREPPVSTGAYHPQVEAISPTLPADPIEEIRTAKDDLLQQITKVDHEIEKTERAIQMLKKKEQSLEEASAKPLVRAEELSESSQPKHRSLAQKIYAENRKKAASAHGILSTLGPSIDLPLYNQPNDAEVCREVITRHQTFRTRLLLHFRKIKSERMTRSISLSERYGQLSCDWRMRVEKIESSAKRKAKEAKNRELFEKVFPELRKQREDKERFNRVGARVKSEADMEEIMDNLHEQEVEEKKMRSYAVIPPLMLDQRHRRCIFQNENGALIDMETDFKERQNFNVWTSGEKEIFKEKFLQHPKNFGAIAASLDRKSAQDCVRYYYLSKKTENYKQLLRKSRQRTRSSRNPQKSNQNQTPCIVDAMTTGVTTRLQREKCEAQKTVRADRAAASANTGTSIVASSTTSATSTNITNTTVTSTSSNSSTTSADGIAGTKSPSLSPPPGVITVSSTTIPSSCSIISTSVASPMETTPASTSCSTNVITISTAAMPIPTTANSLISTSPLSSDAVTATTILPNCVTSISTTSSTSPLLATSTSSTITTTPNSNSTCNNDKNNDSSSSSNNNNNNNNNSNTSKETATNLLCDISSSLSNSNSSNLNSNSGNSNNNNINNLNNLISLSSSTIASSTATTTSAILPITAISPTTSIITLPASTTISTSISSTVTITATTTMMTGQIQTFLTSAPLLSTTSSTLNLLSSSPCSTIINSNNSTSNVNNSNNNSSSNNNNNSSSGISVVPPSSQSIQPDNSITTTILGANNSLLNSSVSNVDVNNKNMSGSSASSDLLLLNDALSNKAEDSDAASEPKKRRIDSCNDDELNRDLKDKLHPCFVCKTEMCPRTRPLEKGRGPQYGILEDAIPIGARVCNTCQCKSVRSRYSSCPLPTCPNPKDRVKRFRNLPPRLFELAADIREPIIQEFQIPPNVTKCCSACLIRIRRKMGPHVPGTNLTDDEVVKLKNVLQEIGPKWSQLSEILGKPTVALKTFYYHYKKKYALDTAVSEYYKMHPSEERRTTMTDGDESDLSTSSGDDREVNSDTASAESPKNNLVINSTQSVTSIANVTETSLKDNNVVIEVMKNDDRLAPPLGHAPRKSSSSSKHLQQQQDEYDSSATETADEENESSPANRQSPKVSIYSNQATITMVPTGGAISGPNQQAPQPQFPNGPVNSNPSNVRDLFLNVIERTLKSNGPPHKQPMQMLKNQSGQPQAQPQQQQTQQQQNDNRNDITFVREYRNDGKINLSRSTPTQNSDSLATLSVVDVHGHTTQIQPSLQGIPSQIAATITPVPPQQTLNVQSMQPQTQQQIHEGIKEQGGNPGSGIVVYVRNNEPEDLSIKKTVRDTFPPPQSKQQSMAPSQQLQQQQHGCVTMYRNDPPQPQPQSNNIPPNQFMGSNYLHHHDINRSSKSPSMYISSSPISITQQQQQQQHQQQNRAIPHQQTPPPSSNIQQSQNKLSVSKLTPKLSPKINQNPKGSITHGTPINTTPIQGMQSATTLSPRFDQIRRQTPPSNENSNKMMPGSITQGTPVLLSGHQHHINDKRQQYEYFKNSRQSPQTQHQQQAPPNSQQQQQQPQFGAQYSRSASIVSSFGNEQSRQILLNDFITSQHMMGQQRGSGTGRSVEKDSVSPRGGSNLSNSPATLYYSDKERGRQDYLSRTSPAEHINSVPSPHRTPPPQRQGVIQRHNTGGSKPPSPLPNRIHVMSQQQQQPQVQQPPPQSHHYPGPGRIHYGGGYKNMNQSSAEQYPLSGHEAFSSLVDVAVKQPLLPVPNKDEIKREQHPSQQQPPPQHHDMRYQPISRDHHIAMQMAAQQHQHQHQQQQQQLRHQQHQIDLQRRQQQQQQHTTLYQMEREREQREQFRERERQAQAQAQIERDRAERDREQRERERERHERNMQIERERERERIINEEKEREDRRRDPRMHQVNVAPHIIRGGAPPNMGNRSGILDRDRERGDRTQDSCITTGSLIDAIIAHSINSTSEHPPTRSSGGGNVGSGVDPHRNSFFAGRQDHAHVVSENNGKSHSPNVINIDLESDSPQTPRSSANVITKSIKLGELADSIIAKDFSQNPLSFRPTFLTYPDTIAPTEQWKYRRHMAVKEEIQNKNQVERLTPEVTFDQQLNVHHEPISPPDKRQIIRIQPPSPNIQGMVFPEPVSPPAKRQIIRIQPQSPLATPGMAFSEIVASPEDHFQSSSDRRSSQMQQSTSSVPPVSEFQLDRYMSNKIVEAMRTSDDKMRQDDGGGGNGGPGGSDRLQQQQQNAGRNTPGDGDKRMVVVNNDQQSNQPPQQQYQQPQSLTTFAQSTYAYPFSALSVGATAAASLAAAAAVQSSQQQTKMSNSDGGDNQLRQQQQLAEPKPLLSAQYEELSDVDD